MEIVHAWFGEGRMEKDLYRYLASRLFHDSNPWRTTVDNGGQPWTFERYDCGNHGHWWTLADMSAAIS